MKLDPYLGKPDAGPGKQGEIKVHHGGVQAEELVLEAEFVLRGQRLAAPLHQGKQRVKEGGGALIVGVAKGGAGHRLDSQMVEFLIRYFRPAMPCHRLPRAVGCMESRGTNWLPGVTDRALRPVPCSASSLSK